MSDGGSTKRSPTGGYRVFKTALGYCAVAGSRRGICALVLPLAGKNEAETALLRRVAGFRNSARAVPDLVKAVQRYFYGWRTEFDEFPLDLSSGSDFQQRVWEIARRVPYGQVRTYHWIALEMGRPEATRAIGAALGANPVPLLVPCHRIVGSDGALGGFSAPGGTDLKAAMLALERVPIYGEGENRRIVAAAHR